MSKKVAIVVIHGMGSQTPEFAEDMIMELNERVRDDHNKDHEQIAWMPIYWADLTEHKQLAYWRKAKQSNDLDFIRLRKFVVTALGDAVAYRPTKSEHNTTYQDIHNTIKERIQELHQGELNGNNVPLIVMAHSLGAHIMSNYIWDIQNKNEYIEMTGTSSFERMNWLAGMITFGCNIPLFSFAYDEVKPITFPATRLPKRWKEKARWLNFYDPDDILGYPLKQVSPSYKQVVNRDIPINVGGILASWNPGAHTQYWTDNDFTKPVAKYIAEFLPPRE